MIVLYIKRRPFISLLKNIELENITYIQSNIDNVPNIDSLLSIPDYPYSQYKLLGYSCKQNLLDITNLLICKGVNLSISESDDIYIYDSLYTAINNNNLELVEALLKHKANLNAIYTEYGLTPLALSCNLGLIEISK